MAYVAEDEVGAVTTTASAVVAARKRSWCAQGCIVWQRFWATRPQCQAKHDSLHPRGGTTANNPLACFVGVSGRERTPFPRH